MMNMSLETVDVFYRLSMWTRTARPGDEVEVEVPADEASDHFAWVVRAILGHGFHVVGGYRKCKIRRKGMKRGAVMEMGSCMKRVCP